MLYWLTFRDGPGSAPLVLGLKVCTTTPNTRNIFWGSECGFCLLPEFSVSNSWVNMWRGSVSVLVGRVIGDRQVERGAAFRIGEMKSLSPPHPHHSKIPTKNSFGLCPSVVNGPRGLPYLVLWWETVVWALTKKLLDLVWESPKSDTFSWPPQASEVWRRVPF